MTAFPAVLLLAGAALGPHGLAVLTPAVIAWLDPAAPVGLVILGILAAMRMRAGRGGSNPAPMALEATITGLIVAAALLVAQFPSSTSDVFPGWPIAAVIFGIAAAASDADDAVVPIVVGALLLASSRESTAAQVLIFTAQCAAISLLIAGSGWLLLARAAAMEEQRVGTFGSVLLLGGAADYLSMSALLCGAVAGLCWRFASSTVVENLRRDVAYAAESLLALVLLLAGAHATFSAAALSVAAAYVVLRAAGKFGGSWLGHRLWPAVAPPSTRTLLAPGAFGIAFALNVVRALGPEFEPVLTVVVAGTIASSMAAALVPAEAVERSRGADA